MLYKCIVPRLDSRLKLGTEALGYWAILKINISAVLELSKRNEKSRQFPRYFIIPGVVIVQNNMWNFILI